MAEAKSTVKSVTLFEGLDVAQKCSVLLGNYHSIFHQLHVNVN